MQITTVVKNKRYSTVKDMPKHYSSFTISSKRWLIFNEKTNGFAQCIKRLGKKILIDLDAFEEWVNKQ